MVWMKLTNGESTANLSPLAAETLKPVFDRIMASVVTQINHSSFCRVSGYVGSLIVRCTNSPLAIAASKTFFRNRMGRKYWFSFFASSALEYVFCRSILFLGIFFVLSFGQVRSAIYVSGQAIFRSLKQLHVSVRWFRFQKWQRACRQPAHAGQSSWKIET